MQMNLSADDAAMLWNDVVGMAQDYSDEGLLPWLDRVAPVSLENGVMTLSTRQNWTERKIMSEYRERIEALLYEITMEPIQLAVTVTGSAPRPAAAPAPATAGTIPVTPACAEVVPAGALTGTLTSASSMFHVKQDAFTEELPPAAPAAGTPQPPASGNPDSVATAPALAPQPAEPQPAAQRLSAAALAGAAAANRASFYGRPAAADASTPSYVPGLSPAQLAAREVAAAGGFGDLPAVSEPVPPVPAAAAEPSRDTGVPPVIDTNAIPARESAPSAPVAPSQPVEAEEVVPILDDGSMPASAVSSGFTDFNFDTYIVGEANSIAFNMARAVAEQPGSVPNPLFIWGPSGNGKTHLLLSILNYIYAHQPNMRARYVPTNTFVEQYVDDIRNKKLKGSEVLREYRDIDVLLVDDVQFFEDKQESVSTFFDIFNQLILDGKQIVLAADVPPDYLSLDDRMRTRFGMGLVVDIKAPTYEMKRSILRSFYERCRERMAWCGVEIPPKLFDVMAQLAPNSPRNMQGLVTSLMIKADTNPSILSPEGIKGAVSGLFKSTEVVSVPSIIKTVSDAYGVSIEDIKGKSRARSISEARQVVMWMARQLTDESYENIGAELGGRDHSTVYYGISTIEKRSLEDKSYSYKLERLKKEIVG